MNFKILGKILYDTLVQKLGQVELEKRVDVHPNSNWCPLSISQQVLSGYYLLEQ